MTKRRTSLKLLSLALLGATTLASGPALAADKMRVGLAAIYPAFMVPFVAQDLGYFKEKNLEVELTTYRGGGAVQEAMAAGELDMLSNSPPGAALAIKKGVKQKIVALTGGLTPAGWYIVVPKDSPLKTLADLKGKTIGVSAKASTTDFFAMWAAKKGGVTAQSIPLGGPGLVPALKAKQIDAAVLYPPLSYKMMIDGEYRSIGDLGAIMPPVLPDTWVASDDLINKRPDVLNRFLQANMKAVAYMQANEKWTLDYMKKYFEEKDDRVVKQIFDTFIKVLRTDGMVKAEWLKESFDLAALAGVTDVPPVNQTFTDKFVPVKWK